MIWLFTSPLWLPLFMLMVYAVGIQYERGGWWGAFWLVGAPALVLDVILAHSLLALYLLDYPQRNEWTFSQQLARLIERGDWRGGIARYLKRVLDAIAPSGLHVIPRN